MMGIVFIAYVLGNAVRFNIQYVEPLLEKHSIFPYINRIEAISRLVLGIAYIISVAFYLKLLSAFILHDFGVSSPLYENGLTSLLLLFIGIMGKFRGLSILELLETYSVNIKLTIITELHTTLFSLRRLL